MLNPDKTSDDVTVDAGPLWSAIMEEQRRFADLTRVGDWRLIARTMPKPKRRFIAGDVVGCRDDSGSPMTVIKYVKPTLVLCQWFDANEKLRTARLEECSLDLVKPREPSGD